MGFDEPTAGSRAETKLAQGTRGFRIGGESIELLLLRGDPLTPFDDFANFDQKSRLCKEHCYKKKAASVGQNGRLSASCNFFSF